MIATAEPPIVFEPTPKQCEFIAACESECLLGGGAGSGKSLALLLGAAHQVDTPRHHALIMRKSFPELRHLIIKSLEIFPSIGGTWNEAKSTWRFRSGARIEFGFWDGPQGYSRYLGQEYNHIAVDELCEWPGDALDAGGEPVSSGWMFLTSRLRTTKGSNLRREMRATACALGVGKSWVQRHFCIDDAGGPSLVKDPLTGFHRRFIPAKLDDNPHIDDAYRRNLEGLPKAQRDALLHGRWDSCVGGIFEEFDHNLHEVAPFNIPRGWPVWRACDDGWSAPLACLHFCHDADITDTIFVVREIYARQLTPETAASLILRTDAEIGNGQQVRGVIDSSAFSSFGTGPSRAARMNDAGCGWRAVEKGPGSVVAGLAEIHRRLALRSDGQPGLKVFRGHCPNLVRELTSAVYSTSRPEEVSSSCSMHALDALRYGLTSRPHRAGRMRII